MSSGDASLGDSWFLDPGVEWDRGGVEQGDGIEVGWNVEWDRGEVRYQKG